MLGGCHPHSGAHRAALFRANPPNGKPPLQLLCARHWPPYHEYEHPLEFEGRAGMAELWPSIGGNGRHAVDAAGSPRTSAAHFAPGQGIEH